ncbi:MAG: hypothetical protein CTY15_12150 [Methylocystis sp.]|nr:MAG: hypothetical protein CTY15_12150 [Methylocystis sp.]
MNEPRAKRLKEVAVEEVKAYVPVFLYVWILLAVLNLHKELILSQAHIFERQGFAIVKALAFSKVLFLADKTPLGRILGDRPLVWPVLAKAAIFGVILLAIDILEELAFAKFFPSHPGAEELDFRNLKILFSTLALTIAALIPFFGLRELSSVLGEAQMMKLFFKERSDFVPIQDAGPEQAEEQAGYVEGQYYLLDGQYYYFAEGRLHPYVAPESGEVQ